MKVTERILGTACMLVFALLATPASFGAQNKDTTKPAPKATSKSSNQSAPQKPAAAAPQPAQPVQQTQPRGPVTVPGGGGVGKGVGQQPQGRGGPNTGGTGRGGAGTGGAGTQTQGRGGPGTGGTGGIGTNRKAGGGPLYHPRPDGTPPIAPKVYKDGSKDYRAGQNTIHTDPDGRITKIERSGTVATGFRPDGRAGHIEHTRTDGSRMVVDRGVRGERRIEVVRPDGVRVVAVGHRGFVERPLRPGYFSRTYVVGGRPRVFVYRRYAYRGIPYYRYVPRVHYAPAFYGWAYRPWHDPAVYAWGWGPRSAWFYGGYFAPAPYYANATLWLADYLLAENLKLAYENQQAASADAAAPPPPEPQTAFTLTPQTKQLIAEEVRQQILAEQAAAQQQQVTPPSTGQPEAEAPPPALDPNQRTFVVSASLDVTANGESCALTGGDIIFRSGELQDDGKVGVTILSSKPGDCKANSGTAVELVALQEMQNQFREQIAGGMETLAAKQGQGSIPAGPVANPTQVAEGQAQPAPDAQTLLAQLNQEADQTEAEIKQAANGGA